ncbi:hypothetical protein NE237_008385 [Protea cynaroides]|uniref:GDSL esterase/lipase n=1 Tax=Protea cynaroides TaxID=273540 RepID=A0A9Q0QZA0_9MAGN|nr:hypothetical protein NE237_008385 [Protea cynaroides]
MASFIFFLFFLFFLVEHLNTMNPATCNASALPKFPALLVFGDSTVDTGNNNFIPTIFKGNHFPYGREFLGHIPTGRFSDGRLVHDLLASALGIKEFIPPFLDPHLSDKEIPTGVSFASAGSGFDDMTTLASRVITMSQQLRAGTNDFLFNYYDLSTRREQSDISGYQDFLLQKLQDIVKVISLSVSLVHLAGGFSSREGSKSGYWIQYRSCPKSIRSDLTDLMES